MAMGWLPDVDYDAAASGYNGGGATYFRKVILLIYHFIRRGTPSRYRAICDR